MAGFASETPVRNQPGVWYFIHVSECPVCGRGEEHRTRMPPPAPPKEARYKFEQAYDYCTYG
jgi:hypothetical protein